MKKMDKQTRIAGILGVIAFIAILCELFFGEISTASVSASVKDSMGILMDVIVFILAIKIAAKKTDEESLEKKLENALDKWRAENSNMIIRDEEYDKDKNFFSFFMRTDLKNFFGDTDAEPTIGWFVRIPKIGSADYTAKTFKIQFHLNVSTFLKGRIVDDRKSAFKDIAKIISTYLQSKCNVNVTMTPTDADATITVIANGLIPDEENGITVDDRIKNLISIIDTAYMCYLVAGNFKVEK